VRFGQIPLIVDLTNAVAGQETLSNVCLGVGTAHPPAGIHNNPACGVCGNTDPSTWQKGKKDGDDYIVVDASQVRTVREQAIGGTKDTLTVFGHPAPEVHQAMKHGKGTYQLAPSKEAFRESYCTVVDVIKRHPELAFLVAWTPTSRTNVYELVVDANDNLLMQERVRAEDVKVVDQPFTEPAKPVQEGVDKLVLPGMVKPFDPKDYVDSFRANLENMIAAAQGQPGAVATPVAAPASAGVDMMALLAGLAAAAESGKEAS